MNSHYYYLLDPGHGGVNSKGEYTTAPAKMYTFEDGLVIYEGVSNRLTCKKLGAKLKGARIDYFVVADDVQDTPLAERVRIADQLFKKNKKCIYLSVHSNSGKGKGIEVFTSPGQTKSDKVADVFLSAYSQFLPQFPIRKDVADGDWDKEENFYVLRKTDCPAILVENLFFDNRSEAEFLLSEAGQEAIAETLFQAILELERTQPI
jgi:N-acetylmuramoyl-L-alanine amidase